MANSQKNDQPNKLLAHAIKKSVWRGDRWGGRRGWTTETEKRGSTEGHRFDVTKRARGRGGGDGDGREGCRGRRDIAVGASLVKLTGDITAGVKNERDIKKISPSVPFVRPRDRGRRAVRLIEARKKKYAFAGLRSRLCSSC